MSCSLNMLLLRTNNLHYQTNELANFLYIHLCLLSHLLELIKITIIIQICSATVHYRVLHIICPWQYTKFVQQESDMSIR